MVRIKTMLVPTDFSTGSIQTLTYAAGMARSLNAAVHVVHVISPIVFASDIVLARYGFDGLTTELELSANRNLAKIARKLSTSKTKHSTIVLHGKADEEILAYAKKIHTDLICIASHGRSNIENMMFGSTTEKVLRKATCPVLVVRIKE